MPEWLAKWFGRKKKERPEKDVEADYIDVDPESGGPTPVKSAGRSSETDTWLAKLRPSYRREQQISVLQEGFDELVGLTRTIREHMDQQVQTQKTLVDLMKNMPEAVEGLKSVGKATEQQTETLGLLRQQMETNVRHGEQMIDSIRRFNQTLGRMDETSKGTASTVAALAERSRESEDLLRQVLERSERRLVCMIGSLVMVTLVVLSVGFYYRFSGPGPAPVARDAVVSPLGVDETLVTIPRDVEPPMVEEELDIPDVEPEEELPVAPEEEIVDEDAIVEEEPGDADEGEDKEEADEMSGEEAESGAPDAPRIRGRR